MIEKDEFEKSLKQPLTYWGNKSKSEVQCLLGNEVAQMVGFNQRNPHHCFDLFLHSLYTVDNLNNAPLELQIAAFFHDIGKTVVAKEKEERLVFYGHAKESAKIAKRILFDLKYKESEIEIICFYIEHHDDFISWVLPTESYDKENPYLVEITAENIKNHINYESNAFGVAAYKDKYIIWSNLLLLCEADAAAQSEFVYQNGVMVSSRNQKMYRCFAIRKIVSGLYK